MEARRLNCRNYDVFCTSRNTCRPENVSALVNEASCFAVLQLSFVRVCEEQVFDVLPVQKRVLVMLYFPAGISFVQTNRQVVEIYHSTQHQVWQRNFNE